MHKIHAMIASMIFGCVVVAQSPNLREQVTAKNSDVVVQINADRENTSFAQVLVETDLIVRGRVGGSTSRLSSDERDVLTTYELSNPIVAFSALQPKPLRSGETPRPMAITFHGGTVRIGAFTVTVTYAHTPKLVEGIEIIALLRDRAGDYVPAGGDGILEIHDRHVRGLLTSYAELRTFDGAPADESLRQIVALRKNVHR